PTYIVTSPTTIAVKTPSGGCPATTASGGDNIVINFAGSNTLTKTGGLFFINPPAIVAAANKPVITENSALLLTTNQVQRVLAAGGQTVRVKAASTYAFDPRTAQGLAVTFGGKAVTDLKVYDDSGSAPVLVAAGASSAPALGNFMTFKTGIGMTAADAS